MIYLSGGIKGGTGKTTFAVNLAVGLTHIGRDVLLVDADDQESATDFTNWRNQKTRDYTAVQLTGLDVRYQVLSLSEKYQDIVIDTGGRDTESQRAALTVANVAIFPFEPRSLNMWTIEKLSKLIKEIHLVNEKLTCFSFINKADPLGKDNEAAASILDETEGICFLKKSLGNRKSFANSAALGQAIFEYTPKDIKAEEEFSSLFLGITQQTLYTKGQAA